MTAHHPQVPPAEEPRKSAVDLKQRRMMKTKAHEAKGEDYSLRAVLLEAKVSEEVVTALASSGVDELEELISVVSRGDHHEELRKRGVGKLGVRAKLATLVQPYWQALAIKEQGNSKYKESRFEDAANLYTKAIQLIPCGSTDLALNCYANRAACFQQMREYAARHHHRRVRAYPTQHLSTMARAARRCAMPHVFQHARQVAGGRSPRAIHGACIISDVRAIALSLRPRPLYPACCGRWCALSLISATTVRARRSRPNLALTDVKHVLTFDPSNAKALARKHVYEQQIAGM